MSEEPDRSTEPLNGALGTLPSDVALTIDIVVRRKDPELGARLRSTSELTYEDRSAVERLLSSEFSTQVHGPDWEPTDYGLAVERAVVQFLMRFPIEEPPPH